MNLVSHTFAGAAIRTFTPPSGEPVFVANDVTSVLGYANHSAALAQHCKRAAAYLSVPTPGGVQETRVLTEPDVYRLIIGSHLPAAVEFERWVFEEVLPSIRKTGSYTLTREDQVQAFQALLPPKIRGIRDFVEQGAALRAHLQRLEALVPARIAPQSFRTADYDPDPHWVQFPALKQVFKPTFERCCFRASEAEFLRRASALNLVLPQKMTDPKAPPGYCATKQGEGFVRFFTDPDVVEYHLPAIWPVVALVAGAPNETEGAAALFADVQAVQESFRKQAQRDARQAAQVQFR